ncbi:MAG: hypothetical protein DI598_05475 [Pseudopedobacter saltans]|uniref:Glycosyl transferase family 1 domain-containing protein n=1 Tax=Pseudopedobacter saltans TaxID=151895 RepID=A0A2W5F9E8_9SPHI|nr:MAG: hypothetical protein DI598_05475 [Pseudopedobacter saltans]
MAATEHYKAQVVFYGALGRKENSEAVQWFIEKVYKPYHLSDKVTFCIIGGGGDKLKMQYADLPGVRFTGFVEKPENIFVESLCMVVPLLNGGGIKIKVLEGMTCALPVLTNEIGIEGIGGGDGSEYLFCKTPKQYEDGILSLLSSPVLRREIGENARAWINEHFDYEKDLEAYKLELIQLSNKIC